MTTILYFLSITEKITAKQQQRNHHLSFEFSAGVDQRALSTLGVCSSTSFTQAILTLQADTWAGVSTFSQAEVSQPFHLTKLKLCVH